MIKSAEIGKYIYSTRIIGKGSFSKVYKGLDTTTDSIVAIKIIDKSELKNDILNRLHDEILLMRNLHHSGILDILDHIETGEFFYMILEYCAGGDLSTVIKRGKIPEETARDYMCQIADALSYLQSRNVIHRDLKPHNMLLSGDYKIIKLSDFNFAKEMYATDLAQTLCGSPLYMAPEIIKKHDYTTKSDLWSVGVIIYEIVTGRNPFADAVNVIDLLEKINTRQICIVEGISEECNDLIHSLLQKDPEDRCDWETFFNNPWLQRTGIVHVALDENHMWESVKPMSIRTNKYNVDVMDNYIPLGVTPPKYVQSEPVRIKNRTRTTSQTEHVIARSAPERTLTDNIWKYMTSSVGIIKGAVDYIQFLDKTTF